MFRMYSFYLPIFFICLFLTTYVILPYILCSIDAHMHLHLDNNPGDFGRGIPMIAPLIKQNIVSSMVWIHFEQSPLTCYK